MGASTTLPATLSPGIVSIYGMGVSLGGLRSNKNVQFGIVNQSYSNPVVSLVGQSVMFNPTYADKVVYVSETYFLVPEDKIILIEV